MGGATVPWVPPQHCWSFCWGHYQLCPPLAAERLVPAERRAPPSHLPCRDRFDGQRVRHFRLLLLWTLSWDLPKMERDLAHPLINTLCLWGLALGGFVTWHWLIPRSPSLPNSFAFCPVSAASLGSSPNHRPYLGLPHANSARISSLSPPFPSSLVVC